MLYTHSKIIYHKNLHYKLFCFFILIFISTFFSSISAQEIRFKNLSVLDGLSHNSVTAFCQDHFGFIWIGTSDGLNKFDGNRFIIYRNDPADSTSISDNSILSVFEGPLGYIWIGTEKGGLNRFDPKTETFTHFVHNPNDINSISNNHVSSIVSDKKGNLWIGTDTGLNKLSAEEKVKQKPAFIKFFKGTKDNNTISDNTIYSLLLDSKGALWLSLSDNFGADKLEFTDDNFTSFKKTNLKSDPNNKNSISGNWILYVFEDSKGRIWISSWSDGLIKYEPAKNKFTRYKNDPEDEETIGSNYIEMVIEDNQGTIWVATYYGGLSKYVEASKEEPEYFINYKFNSINPFSLADNRATILFKDRSGIIWIGTAGHGFSRFNPLSQFRNISLKSPDGLTEYQPSAIIKTSDGNLWIGTKEGILFRIRKDAKKPDRFQLRRNERLSSFVPFISSLFEDEDRTLWITTSGRGVFYIPQNSVSSPNPDFTHMDWSPESKAKDISFTFVREDSKKNMYFGTMGRDGLFFLSREDKIKKHFDLKNIKTLQYAWSFLNDGEDFWLGGWACGLKKINGNKNEPLTTFRFLHDNPYDKKGIPNNDIYTIQKTKDNSIWFGNSKSLSQLLPGSDTLIHYRYADGLANETVYGILEDNDGNLWISTYNGLSKLDVKTKLFTNFYREDGIQANEFNSFSYFKDNNGLLYFGGINGVTIVNPKIDIEKIDFPELKITGLHFSNLLQENKHLINAGIIKQSFNFCNEITLPYDKNAFSIEFSTLEFNSPQKIKYMYKLEGLNNDWISVTPLTHTVNFMNLEPKTYTFKIRSTNRDGIWNPNITELTIRITPPFWNTMWFKFILLLLVCGIIVFAYERKIIANRRQREALQKLVDEQTLELRERNADLESFSYSVSHDLRTPLRSIYSFSQIIKEDFGHQLSGEALLYFDKITKAAYNMTDLIDGILKMAKIARTDLNKTHIDISLISGRIVDDLKTDYPDKIIEVKIQPDISVTGDLVLLTTVMENLISNAFKFSSKNDRILIEIGKTRAFDRTKTSAAEAIFIKDNGIGFDMKYSEKLFQVFQRLHSSQEFNGTGIGLANVKKIINRHNGTIWAESELEKGTTFFFTV